jgi:hypothetical protein
MSIYGYCRISTAKQSIDRQIRNIKAAYAYDLTDNAVITINGKDISGSALNDNDEYTVYDLQAASDYIYVTCPALRENRSPIIGSRPLSLNTFDI